MQLEPGMHSVGTANQNSMTGAPPTGDDIRLADLPRDEDDLRERGLFTRMAGALSNMRQSTRELIDEGPSEARLLFFVLLSDVIFFLSRTLSLVVAPGSATAKFLPLEIGLWLIGILFLRTATLYLFSGLVGFVCRALGGQGSWRDTRAAVFWASLVAAPIGVLGALIGAGFDRLAPAFPVFGTDAFVVAPLSLGIVAFVWFVSAAVAEAQKFTRTSLVFMAFSCLSVVGAIAAIAVHARVTSG